MNYYEDDDRHSLRREMNMSIKKDMDKIYGISKMTEYRDVDGRIVHVGDWIEFLWWMPTMAGTPREVYYYGRILMRKGKLVFRYRDDFSRHNRGFHERRLSMLNFDSSAEWRITNNEITHYGVRYE